jgi:LacI family transcriptional regulator
MVNVKRRPTITEVARLAGVSHQTVSRYIRFSGDGLKPATRKRVESAIRTLDYRPNLSARSMRTRRTGRLAVLMPPLVFSPHQILAGATATAHAAGYVVEVLSLEGGPENRTQRMLELSDLGQVEGILSFVPIPRSSEKRFRQGATVVVSADFDDEMRSIGELTDATPVARMIEHLAEMGHRRFLHVAGDQQFASARSRKRIYLETIERLGLKSLGVYDGDWSGESGVVAIQSLPRRPRPSAVIAANDLVAVGVIRGAKDLGWDVPGDISVTGWDNYPTGKFLSPSLTTVDMDLVQLGSNAMTRLLAALHGQASEIPAKPIQRIIWRESTTPYRPKRR